MGTPEENKALAQRFMDALSAGDVATAASCFDPSNYYSNAHAANLADTWERMKARRRNPALSDVTQEHVALVADGDRVVNHTRMIGTHTGELFGMPATGRGVRFAVMDVVRIEDGQIVEHWGLVDLPSLQAQLAATG